MSQYLRHTPDVLESACRELSKFLDVQEYWWPLFVNLPTSSQARRLALVDAVFERVRDPDYDVAAFQAEYAASHSEDLDEGVADILRAWLDVAAAAPAGGGGEEYPRDVNVMWHGGAEAEEQEIYHKRAIACLDSERGKTTTFPIPTYRTLGAVLPETAPITVNKFCVTPPVAAIYQLASNLYLPVASLGTLTDAISA
ncbi:hypothetical protein Z517_08082 [Fonsecaea pedrosoi CBS 271.37]|uniref:Uncharacterized protein n=1 Tax=Fonsecaea pedrosoi CBS 271.37 TaxID=1442368 RepID=A0A0D2GC56_9EURO|nr:uncharacterized protein Z517_08082 [Fonsecaea pedrosoi CBS 271.37]KIW78248.1 hypothetical protein Z517_08082 [Fonsecaea pedrosoi CBS 271.37]